MFERFTDRARVAVTAAEGHARRFGHAWVGTEHLPLGLTEGDGVAARALSEVGLRSHPVSSGQSSIRSAAVSIQRCLRARWVARSRWMGPPTSRSRLASRRRSERASARPCPSEQVATAPVGTGRTEPADVYRAAVPDAEVARCPGCREPLAPNLGADVMPAVGELERLFTVAHCRACGHVLAVLPDG